jgi:hypothetical protein
MSGVGLLSRRATPAEIRPEPPETVPEIKREWRA